MTLSYWLRDYVYIRMGGREKYLRNILIVFALVGLWHGAGWNFVAWGVYHSLLVILSLYAIRLGSPGKARGHEFTFGLVSFGWPLFFMNLNEYGNYVAHLVSANWQAAGVHGPKFWLYLLAIGCVTFVGRERFWLYNEPEQHKSIVDSPLLLASLMFAGLLSVSLSKTFVYFRF